VARFLQIDDFLDIADVEWIRREMAAADSEAATVLGNTPRHRVLSNARKLRQVAVGDAPRAAVAGFLAALQPRIQAHFDRPLQGFDEPQFLRYGVGDYFVAHQDGNTPLVHDESRFRKVSVVVSLTAQSAHPAPGTFCGGSFVLHDGPGPPLYLAPAPGTLLAFRSETTHEVLPVTHGQRLSIVSWYRGPEA
jgi:predicted 2-oxoglutarate/Fe(II)-dependent dioxygenase YbiX